MPSSEAAGHLFRRPAAKHLFVEELQSRVEFIYQLHLLFPSPMLDLLFAGDGRGRSPESLEMNQPVQAILFREAFQRLGLMLPDATMQGVGYADIERSVSFVREDIDPA